MSKEDTTGPSKQSKCKTTQIDETNQEKADPEKQKIRRVTISVFVLCVLLFAWYLASDRITPSSSQARVRAFVIPITPEISGTVVRIGIENNQVVQQDDLLIEIDPARYELAVAKAEAELELAGQQSGADVEAVSAAQASVLNARADKLHAEAQAKRVLSLTEKGIMAQSFGDQAKAAIAKANAALEKAEADLRKAKQQMGKQGEQNSRLRAAIAALRGARLDLQNTRIHAPHLGVITNLQINLSHYAQTGNPLMTFISAEDVWIEAYLRENNLERIQPGDKAEFVLDSAPGRVFQGNVTSVGFGVNWGTQDHIGQLQSVESQTGWLRSAQRIPVIIEFPTEQTKGLLRVGGQADVIVYTGDNWLMNTIGKLWIRLVSLLSYAY